MRHSRWEASWSSQMSQEACGVLWFGWTAASGDSIWWDSNAFATFRLAKIYTVILRVSSRDMSILQYLVGRSNVVQISCGCKHHQIVRSWTELTHCVRGIRPDYSSSHVATWATWLTHRTKSGNVTFGDATLIIVFETTHSSIAEMPECGKESHFSKFLRRKNQNLAAGVLWDSLLNCSSKFKLTALKGQQGSSGDNPCTSQPKNRFLDALVRGREICAPVG